MARNLVVYISPWCGNCRDTQQALESWRVPFRKIDIQRDLDAAKQVRTWTGFDSVPTLVVAEANDVVPAEEPAPLAKGASPRGVDRGSMLTEPSRAELRVWLVRHGLLAE
jgi:glutaredoxin